MSAADLVETLACIAREVPEARRRMQMTLGKRCVKLVGDDEVTYLQLDDAAALEPDVTLYASRETLSRVVQGDEDVLDAVLAGRVDAVGAPRDLVAVFDTLTWFMHGAVRCLSTTRFEDVLRGNGGTRG